MADSTIKRLAATVTVDADAVRPKPRLSRRRSIVREFALTTTAHGIPGIARSESLPNRIFWTVVTLAFAGVTLHFVIKSILAYFDYPMQTQVILTGEWPQWFPAVTICNYAVLRFDGFIGPFRNYTNQRNSTTGFSASQAKAIPDYFQYKLGKNESLEEAFFPLSSLLMSCVYNGLPCSVDDFVPFLSSDFGRCYSLNIKAEHVRNGTFFANTDNGQMGSLQLQLYAHGHQYVPYVTDAVGFIAMIHDNREIPRMRSGGIYLGGGRKHRISYIKVKYNRLGPPYFACSDQTPPMLQAFYDRISQADYGYGDLICYDVCIQVYTYDTCGCVDPTNWANRYVMLPGTTKVIDAPLCNLTDPCYTRAATEFRVTDWIWAKYCSGCSPECVAARFLTKASSMTAPADWMLPDIKAFVEASSIPLPANWSSTWQTEIQKNYVGLSVECESTNVDNYNQSASLTVMDVLANVGGQSGLWIGISFLSLMEVVEMLSRLIRHQYHLLREKMRRRQEVRHM